MPRANFRAEPGIAAARAPSRAGRRRAVAAAGHGVAEPRVERMLEGVCAAGLRLTPQRVAVVRELATDESHPTAQELFDRLRVAMPTVSFATVYNTLDALKHANLCQGLALSPGSGRFDPNRSPHDHLVCDRCGAVRDVKGGGARGRPASTTRTVPPSSGAAGDVRRRRIAKVAPGFRLRVVEQVFRGLCAECSGSPRTEPAQRPRFDFDWNGHPDRNTKEIRHGHIERHQDAPEPEGRLRG